MLKESKIALIIIIISITLAIFNFTTIPFSGGDNFSYFLLSKSFVNGEGYREIWNINNPLHTQYPPIFPILLLSSALLNSYTFAKIIVFMCYILMLWFTYKLFQKLTLSKTIPIIALALLAFSSVVIQYSSLVLSEIPYTMFSVFALYLFIRKKYWFAMLFATITFLTRTTGITLLLAMSWCYWRRNEK